MSYCIIGAGMAGLAAARRVLEIGAQVTIFERMDQLGGTWIYTDEVGVDRYGLPVHTSMYRGLRTNLPKESDVSMLTETGAKFTNGSEESFDVVVYCTGFRYNFPFLGADCGIEVQDNHVQPLYKHCININHPTMAFIGLPFYVCAAQMMDLQVRFCLAYLTGRQHLPPAHEMLDDAAQEFEDRLQRGYKKRHAHMMGPEQGRYYDDLAKTAQIETIPLVMTKLHNESSQRFVDDLIHFREDVFRIVDDEYFEYVKE
uniref:Flavin-containing monooxygenase n=1 Tax=Anopheles melas TaxID=34690 RepID=A0A182TSG8_9DIPT